MKAFAKLPTAISIFWLCGVQVPAAAFSSVPAEDEILDAAGSNPTVAFDRRNGTFYATWVRSGKNDLKNEVVVSRWQNGLFTTPVAVSGGDTGVVSETANPAQIAISPAGDIFVLYTQQVPSPLLEKGRGIPRLVRSDNGGRSFSAPANIATHDAAKTSVEMTDLTIAPDGSLFVAWLDHRNEIARAELPEDLRPKDVRYLDEDDPTVQVRLSRSLDGGETFSPSMLVADGASERSRVALATAADGTVIAAWRTKLNQFKGSYDAVRDVEIASSHDGGRSWSDPKKVHNDRFKAGDCPQITVGLDTDGTGRVHIAWYTGNSINPGIYYAVSENGGRSFSPPATLLTDDWVPYADVKLAVDGRGYAWIAFEDRRVDNDERVTLLSMDPAGKISAARSWPGQAPDITAGDDSVMLLWTNADGAIQAHRTETP